MWGLPVGPASGSVSAESLGKLTEAAIEDGDRVEDLVAVLTNGRQVPNGPTGIGA